MRSRYALYISISYRDGEETGPLSEEWLTGGYDWKLDSLRFEFYNSDSDNKYTSLGDPYIGNRKKIEQLATNYNDVSYNDYYACGYCLSTKTDNISITCDQDFDQQHPKETLLNDITNINYYWAKPFLDGKYLNRRLGDYWESRTNELLTHFNSKDLDLISQNLDLVIQHVRRKQEFVSLR